MSRGRLERQLVAHCQVMVTDLASLRPEQIRNRLAYIVANAEALADMREHNVDSDSLVELVAAMSCPYCGSTDIAHLLTPGGKYCLDCEGVWGEGAYRSR